MGLFDKKFCSICGEKIGLLGNRKLEDGNLCKDCAAKLSPWFTERKQSTVAEIKEQLAYREANKAAVSAFQTTRTLGRNIKVLLDENAGKFMVTSARNIANPGCFATCLQLGMLPLAAAGLLRSDVHVTALTGSTGAGQKLAPTSHFSQRVNNLSVYKAFTHQHLNEIGESVRSLMPSFSGEIDFVPYRGDFARGIIASIYTDCDLSEERARKLYEDYYADAVLTFVSDRSVCLKQVVNTSKCVLSVEKHGGKLLVVSAIDNLLKGASGQAVQNMNLMFGLDERAGLRLKPVAF